jgi:hypothetical protein
MGYGCLEDGSWNPNYKGFAKQVEWGAWQLRYNFHRAEPQRTNLPNYKVGQTMTLSNSGYSSISVTFANRATASLYRYTPHVFNGNYNFWYYFNTWFDASTIKPPPDTPNNTASVTLRTYSSSVVVGSTRSSSSTVSLSGATISYPDGNSWTAKLSPGIGTNTYQIHYSNGQIKPVTIIRHKSADINGDGKVDLLDLSLFGKYWNKTKPAEPLANLNPDVDEAVNILDLSILASNWSK